MPSKSQQQKELEERRKIERERQQARRSREISQVDIETAPEKRQRLDGASSDGDVVEIAPASTPRGRGRPKKAPETRGGPRNRPANLNITSPPIQAVEEVLSPRLSF